MMKERIEKPTAGCVVPPSRRRRRDPPGEGRQPQPQQSTHANNHTAMSTAEFEYLSMPRLFGSRAVTSRIESSVQDCMLESGAYVSYIAETMDPSSRTDPEAALLKRMIQSEDVEDVDENNLTDKTDAVYVQAYLNRIEAVETVRKRQPEKEPTIHEEGQGKEQESSPENKGQSKKESNPRGYEIERDSETTPRSPLLVNKKPSRQATTSSSAAPRLVLPDAFSLVSVSDGGVRSDENSLDAASIRASDSDSIDAPQQRGCKMGASGFVATAPVRTSRRPQSSRRPKSRKRNHKFITAKSSIAQTTQDAGEEVEVTFEESEESRSNLSDQNNNSPTHYKSNQMDKKNAADLKSLRQRSIMDNRGANTEDDSAVRMDQRELTDPFRNFSPLQSRQPASPLVDQTEEEPLHESIFFDGEMQSTQSIETGPSPDVNQFYQSQNNEAVSIAPTDEEKGVRKSHRPADPSGRNEKRTTTQETHFEDMVTPRVVNGRSELDLKVSRSNELVGMEAVNEQISRDMFSLSSDCRSKNSQTSERTAARVDSLMAMVACTSPRRNDKPNIALSGRSEHGIDKKRQTFPSFFVPHTPNEDVEAAEVESTTRRHSVSNENAVAFFVPLDNAREKTDISVNHGPTLSQLMKKHEVLESKRPQTIETTLSTYTNPLMQNNDQIVPVESSIAVCESFVSSFPTQKSDSEYATAASTKSDHAMGNSLTSSIPTSLAEPLQNLQAHPGSTSMIDEQNTCKHEENRLRKKSSISGSSTSQRVGEKPRRMRGISPLTFERVSMEKSSIDDSTDDPPIVIEIVRNDDSSFPATKNESFNQNISDSLSCTGNNDQGKETPPKSHSIQLTGTEGGDDKEEEFSYLRKYLKSGNTGIVHRFSDGTPSIQELERTVKGVFGESGVVLYQPTINLYSPGQRFSYGLDPDGLTVTKNTPEIENLTETEETTASEIRIHQQPGGNPRRQVHETREEVEERISPGGRRRLDPEADCAHDYIPKLVQGGGKLPIASSKQIDVATFNSGTECTNFQDLSKEKVSPKQTHLLRESTPIINDSNVVSHVDSSVVCKGNAEIIDCTGDLNEELHATQLQNTPIPTHHKKKAKAFPKEKASVPNGSLGAPESEDSGFLPDAPIDSIDSTSGRRQRFRERFVHREETKGAGLACPPSVKETAVAMGGMCVHAGHQFSDFLHQSIAKRTGNTKPRESLKTRLRREKDDGMKKELRDLALSEQLLRRELDLVHQQVQLRRRRLGKQEEDRGNFPPTNLLPDCIWTADQGRPSSFRSIGKGLVASSFSTARSAEDDWTENFSPIDEDSTFEVPFSRKPPIASRRRYQSDTDNDEHEGNTDDEVEVIFVEESFLSTDSFSYGDITKKTVSKKKLSSNRAEGTCELGDVSKPIEIISVQSADQSPKYDCSKTQPGDPGMPISVASVDIDSSDHEKSTTGSLERKITPSSSKQASVRTHAQNQASDASRKHMSAIPLFHGNDNDSSVLLPGIEKMKSSPTFQETVGRDGPAKDATAGNSTDLPPNSRIGNYKFRTSVSFRLPRCNNSQEGGTKGSSLTPAGEYTHQQRENHQVISLEDIGESVLPNQSTSSSSYLLSRESTTSSSQSSIVNGSEQSPIELADVNELEYYSKKDKEYAPTNPFNRTSSSASSSGSCEASQPSQTSKQWYDATLKNISERSNEDETLSLEESETCESLSSRVKKLIAKAKKAKREDGHDTFESRSTLTYKIPESLSFTEEEPDAGGTERKDIILSSLQSVSQKEVSQKGSQRQTYPSGITLSRPPRHDQGSLSTITLPQAFMEKQIPPPKSPIQQQQQPADTTIWRKPQTGADRQFHETATTTRQFSKDGMMIEVTRVDDESSLSWDFPEDLAQAYTSGIREGNARPMSPSRIRKLIRSGIKSGIRSGKKLVSKRTNKETKPVHHLQRISNKELLEGALKDGWSVEANDDTYEDHIDATQEIVQGSTSTSPKSKVIGEDRFAAMRQKVHELRRLGSAVGKLRRPQAQE